MLQIKKVLKNWQVAKVEAEFSEELFRMVLLDFLVSLPMDVPLNTVSYKSAMDLIDEFIEKKGLAENGMD